MRNLWSVEISSCNYLLTVSVLPSKRYLYLCESAKNNRLCSAILKSCNAYYRVSILKCDVINQTSGNGHLSSRGIKATFKMAQLALKHKNKTSFVRISGRLPMARSMCCPCFPTLRASCTWDTSASTASLTQCQLTSRWGGSKCFIPWDGTASDCQQKMPPYSATSTLM